MTPVLSAGVTDQDTGDVTLRLVWLLWLSVGVLLGAAAVWFLLRREPATDAHAIAERRLRQLIDAVPAAFFLTNLSGELVLTNRHWHTLTGRSDEAMLDHGWVSAIHPDDVARVTAGMGDPARVGLPLEDTYRILRPDDSIVWVRTNAVPLTEPDGTLTGYAGFSTDITDLLAARDDIRTLRGLIPICAGCKQIRDDGGYWNQLEAYITAHTEAAFSHSLCPSCLEKTLSEDQS